MRSLLTVFRLDDHLEEIHRAATGVTEGLADGEEEEPPFFEEVKARADELIADLISRPAPYDFQDLVAGVLRAIGFRPASPPPGPDRGVDIVAHPDPFGFERPRIKVQVKHRQGTVGGPEVRAFLVTAGGDGTAALVEVLTGREVARARHEDVVNEVAFSPDGRYLATAGGNDAFILPLEREELFARVCARLPRNLTHAEWNHYVGPDIPCHATCPDLPVPEE